MEQPFAVRAGGTDIFRNFILPYPLQQTHYIRAMEILPGSAQAVHHANLVIDRTASLRHAHPGDWKQGLPGMELMVDAGDTFDPDSHFLFWKPDSPVLMEPAGMPWRVDPGNDLVLNMHFKPTGKPETVQARIGLYFTDKAPTKHPMLLQLEHDSALDIPPGDHAFVVEDHLTLPIDVEVLGVYPHAHYLGKDLQGYAILPNGKKKWLIWIRDWDIDRQSVYRYRQPLLLPKGTVLHMHYTYDNSTDNIRNPNSPPIRVRGGNRSVDEMGHLWLQVLPTGKYPAGQDPRLLLEQAWMQDRLRKDPSDPIALYNMATLYTTEGKYAPAISIEQNLLKRTPGDARTLTALGAAFEEKGDFAQARQTYRQGIQAAPEQTEARFDLAHLDLAQKDYADAEAEFLKLLEVNPNDAAAHSGLGVALLDGGKPEPARSEFEKALAVNPRDFTALDMLGQMELSAGDLPRAVELLQEAVASRDDADARESLAMAYAQSGRLGDAATQLKQAIQLRPQDSATHGVLSQVYSSMGQLPDAVREQKLALQIEPNDADGWNNLGVLEARMEQNQAARQDFQKALQIDSSHVPARANLTRLNAEGKK